jgi:exosortase
MTTEPSAQSWRQHACFAGLGLVSAIVCYRQLFATAAGSLTIDAYAPFAFIPPISAVLIWTERRQIFSRTSIWRSWALCYAVLLAVLLWATRRAFTFTSVELFSASCIAAFGLCYGRESLKKAGFPLALMLAIAPLPEPWVESGVRFLQQGSAVATAALFSIARIPFARDGMVFALPKLDIEIAKECSGIRSSLILFICGLVLGHLFLKTGWTKVALAAAVVPVTIVKNGLRIFTLSMLGMYVDPSFLTGKLHRNGGVLFFVLAFAGLAGVIKLLRKLEPENRARVTRSPVVVSDSA